MRALEGRLAKASGHAELYNLTFLAPGESAPGLKLVVDFDAGFAGPQPRLMIVRQANQEGEIRFAPLHIVARNILTALHCSRQTVNTGDGLGYAREPLLREVGLLVSQFEFVGIGYAGELRRVTSRQLIVKLAFEDEPGEYNNRSGICHGLDRAILAQPGFDWKALILRLQQL